MPNWTRNWITYTGSKEELSKIKDLMGESFDFNKIIPMPECLDVVSGSVTTEAIIAYIASLHGGIEHVEESKEAMRFLRKQTFLDFNIDDMNEDIENAIRKNLPFAAQALPKASIKAIQDKVSELFGPLIETASKGSMLSSQIERLKKELPELDDAEREALIRQGQVYVENIHKYGAPTWYDWRCKHWGTKWPACEVSMKEGVNPDGIPTLSYEFDTAWCVPAPVIDALEQKFPEIEYEAWYENEDDWSHSYGVRYIPCEFDDEDC